MKCPKCNGSGDIPRPNGTKLFGLTEVMTCDLCKGVGVVELTNDEWRKTCSTEEFATWLSKISKLFHECGKRDVYPKTMYEEDWEWWLKQPHGGE